MEKQKSTVIMRHANYKSKAKAQRSLTHSLRIKTKNFRPNEWAEELSAHTWISHPESGELIQLNTLTEAQKLEIRDSIIEDAFASKSVSPQIKSDYAKYLYKLKSKIASTEKPDKNGFINEALVTELMHIRDNNPEDFEQRIDAIEGVKRKKQLLTMLAKHHQLAKLVAGTEDQRTAKVHEAFFKFPHQHGVVPDPRRMAECLKDFYATHAPNHHVPLLVVHDDERIEGHQTGAHPHIFVDTEDTVTGERNLNQKLTEAVEKYLAFNPTTVHLWNPDTKEHEEHVIASLKPAKTQYVKAKLQGMILQDMFMQHTRKHFPELELDFTPERERKVRAYNEKYADGHKPKADRQYNLNGWLTEENERLGRELKHAETLADERKQELNETVSKLAESTAALGVASETLAINEATISQQQDNLRQLETTLQANHATIKQQGKKIDAQAKEIAGVSDELKQSKSKLMVANETIAKRHAENGKLEAQIRGQRARINKLKGEAEKGNKLIKAMNVKAKESKALVTSLESEVNTNRATINAQAAEIKQQSRDLMRLNLSLDSYESKLRNIKEQIQDLMKRYVKLVVGILKNKGETPETQAQAEELGICFGKSQPESQEAVLDGAREAKETLDVDGFSTTAHDKLFKQMEETVNARKKEAPTTSRLREEKIKRGAR